MTYEIEKDIPIPPRGVGNDKYPFREMEVGDCLLIPKEGRSAAFNYANRYGLKIVTRQVDQDSIRVWRTA